MGAWEAGATSGRGSSERGDWGGSSSRRKIELRTKYEAAPDCEEDEWRHNACERTMVGMGGAGWGGVGRTYLLVGLAGEEKALHELAASLSRHGEVTSNHQKHAVVVRVLSIHRAFGEVQTSTSELQLTHVLSNVFSASDGSSDL